MICAYAKDATDFTGNGLGPLRPIECKVSETLNGMWELTMSHPADEWGKSARLALGNIIKAPVPAGRTPAVKFVPTGVRDIWKVSITGTRLYLRSGPGQSYSAIHAYRDGTEVVVLEQTTTEWFEVTTPDGKHGWMYRGNLVYVRTEGSAREAEDSIIVEKELREQLFRIYKIEPGLGIVTVYARHVFYDLADNMLGTCRAESVTGAEAAMMILPACRGSTGSFRMHSDLEALGSFNWNDQTPVKAILGSEGLCETWNAELARDWFDVYVVGRVGRDTDIEIRQGKNLKSLSGDIDTSDVITRIVPVGTDKNGDAMYLPEVYVDSDLIDNYPVIKWGKLEVTDAKETRTLTKEQCYEIMRDAAAAQFAAGCDMAACTLDIDFVNLADTVEYEDWAGINDLALGDSVRVYAPEGGVDSRIRLTEYTYDCLKLRYEHVSFGSVTATIATTGISAKQFPTAGITAAKLAREAVETQNLQNGAVNSLKIGQAAIDYAHLGSATVEQLSADALTAQAAYINALTAQTIDTDTLTAAFANLFRLVADNIQAGTITAGTITAALAEMNNASIDAADIGFAHIVDAAVEQLITHDGVADRYFIDKLQVRNLQVVEQAVGSLIVKASNGNYYRLDVDTDAGTVTPTLATVTAEEIAAGVTEDGSRSIIETDLTAADLSATNIKGINALIDKITAGRIDADELFARSATINALRSAVVSASIIQALEGALTLRAIDTGGEGSVEAVVSPERFYVAVNGGEKLGIDEEGVTAEIISSPSVVPRYNGPAPNITIGSGYTEPNCKGLSDACAWLNGKYLDKNITVLVRENVYGDFVFENISGPGILQFQVFTNRLVTGQIRFRRCTCPLFIIPRITNANAEALVLESCGNPRNMITSNGSLTSDHTALRMTYGSECMVVNTTLVSTSGTALWADYGCRVKLWDCKGQGSLYADHGCIMQLAAGVPVGGQNPSYGTIYYADNIVQTSAGGDTPTVTNTVTLTAQTTVSAYGSSGSNRTTSWTENKTSMFQGYSSSFRQMTGMMWFDMESLRSTLYGKTVLSARLTLRRVPVMGGTHAITPTLKLMTLDSSYATGGAVSPGNGFVSGISQDLTAAAREESLDCALSDTIAQALKSNSYVTGFILYNGETAVYGSNTFSRNFGGFYGVGSEYTPTLTVVYNG